MNSRRNILKTVTSVITALALLFGVSACGVADETLEVKPTNVSTVIEMAEEITTGISYTVTEPISFNRQVRTDGEEDSRKLEYVTVFGLADTEVQDHINEELARLAAAEFNEETPVFSGIDEMPELSSDALLNVRAFNTWNSNDIISIVSTKDISDESSFLQYIEGHTFSLEDGRELALGDLFASDFDYLGVINEVIDEAMAEKWTMFDVNGDLAELGAEKLSDGPLANEDTPYFLNERGVNIILKSDNRDISFSDTKEGTICVGYERFGRNWTISGGINSDLYEDVSSQGYMMTYTGSENYVRSETVRDLEREDVWLYDVLAYPEDFPEQLVYEAENMLAEASVSDEDALKSAKSGTVIWTSSNNEVTCYELGDYYMICRETTDNLRSSGTWQTETVCRVFDDNIRELELSDLFASGWDCEDVFKQKLADSWSLGYGAFGYMLETGDVEELSAETLDDLVASGSFKLEPQGITLYTRSLGVSRADGENANLYITPLSVYIPYGEIGLGRFALFGSL